MRDIWSFLLQTLTASGVAALLLLVKAMLRDKLSPRWQFATWGVLAVFLLLPAGLGGRYTLVNWPFYVELLRSGLTGEYGALARVTAPFPLLPPAAPKTAAEWLFVIYVLGAAFFLLRYLISYLRLRLLLRRGRPGENSRIRAVAEKYGLPVCPAVEVAGLPSAFVCGVFRPVLALPAGRETDEKVILHELLHLKYRDAAWGLVICFFRCIHWCNPLLWWCADLAGNDLESLCDQRVLERLEGEERREYGRILLEMADEKYARAPGTSSMANGGRNIRRRIEAIARFKRYPAGMALVSVCVLLVLAAPLAVGAKAELRTRGTLNIPAELASARTVYCTTYAGAFDCYAKSVLTGRFAYRAMCAPLSEQNALAESYRASAAEGHWEWNGATAGVDTSSGYQIYNLTPAGENAYEGLLALVLGGAPAGEEWDSTARSRWMTVQPLRAEKEGERWVILPQGDFRPMQGDTRIGGNLGLPAWEYEAPAGDFTLRMRWQTASGVDSHGAVNWFGFSDFKTDPIPDGEFDTIFYQVMLADYTGRQEDKGSYRRIAASCKPLWGEEEQPALCGPGGPNGSGSSSGGESWGERDLDGDWENEIVLSGDGSNREGALPAPESYAADFYLNGEKVSELILTPGKGGLDLD